MIWLFLRGRMERHKECAWKTLEECTDMWTHLFAGMVGEKDKGITIYSNGNKKIKYRDNFIEQWIHSFKDYKKASPDIIIARGGFKEYIPLLRKYSNAKKVYYGANHGCIPKDGIKYDLIMCDSEEQVRKCKKHGLNGQLFIKPAAPCFYPRDVEKKYDVGFSAIWPKDKRKNVAWVHKTAPKGLKILQMGHACKAPLNFSVKYIDHDRMARAISKCKVVIAPYTKEDSCPRIIPEALACGVPVVALGSCQFWYGKYPVNSINKKYFWKTVKKRIGSSHYWFSEDKKGLCMDVVEGIYNKNISVPVAAKHLRELIV